MLAAIFRSRCGTPHRLAEDRGGATAVTMALSMTVLSGFASLAIDVGYWQMNQHNMQGAADQAAFAAATTAAATSSTSAATTTAKGITAQMGFMDGQNNVTVTVNNPPASGGYSTNSKAWEVIVSQPQPMWFANLMMSSAPTASGRAVALQGLYGNICLLGLDPRSGDTIHTSGSSIVNLSCALASNSSDNQGLDVDSSSNLTATDALIVASSYKLSGSAHFTTSDLKENQPATADPYASRTIPSYGGCNKTNYTPSSSQTITPGTGGTYVFCNGLTINSGVTLTFNPGTYIIDGGVLHVASTGGITGSNVTIILTGGTNGQSCCATVSFAGGANINLTAPTSGSLSGLAIFQDRATPQSQGSTMTGGSTQLISGALYFPNTTLTYIGNSSTSGAGQCTQLIADRLVFTGNSSVKIQCSGAGVATIGSGSTHLVE